MPSTSLSDFPVIMNGTTLPFMPVLQNKRSNIDTVNQSEGGTDIVQRTRTDKLSSSVTLALADAEWVRFFYGLSVLDSFVMRQYSPLLDDYETKTVRMTDFSYSNRKKSEKLSSVIGVWDVSFTLEEF